MPKVKYGSFGIEENAESKVWILILFYDIKDYGIEENAEGMK